MIAMIAAAGEDNTLGRKGELLWHLPDDFKRFKKLTSGHPIIMGRKTFDTFPELLPDRTHIIITRQKDFKAAGCHVVHNMDDALEVARKAKGNDKIWIIGGGEIYSLGMPKSNFIELTRIHHKFEGGDAFFPEIDEKNWLLDKEVYHPKDEKHQQDFTYLTYIRKK